MQIIRMQVSVFHYLFSYGFLSVGCNISYNLTNLIYLLFFNYLLFYYLQECYANYKVAGLCFPLFM